MSTTTGPRGDVCSDAPHEPVPGAGRLGSPLEVESPAPGRWSRLRAPLLSAAGVGAVLAVVGTRDPGQPGHYPTCPFLFTTGFSCPGCGTLRALHALTEGDVATAFHFNPLLLLAIPVFVWVWATSVRRAWLGIGRTWTVPSWMLAALPVIVGAYWILRNVPGFEFLGPGS
jgi:hypothetical protein